jgi:hypothetical protein
VVLILDQPGREPAAEHVPAAPVLGVEGLGVAAVQELHPGRELGPAALDDKVVVGAEQAEGMHAPAEALDRLAEQAEEEAPIVVVYEDGAEGARVRAIGNAARRHVVDTVGEKRAQHPCHRVDASAPERPFLACGGNGTDLLQRALSPRATSRAWP